MKILIFTDPHWTAESSIVRSRGEKYTTRLENLIKSVNWVEQLALLEQCSAVFCLGDFFDSSEMSAEELTALKEIKWNGLSHCWLVGNHELSRGSLEFSSAHLFNLCPNSRVIDKPCNFDLENESTEICFLPYINSTTDKSNISSFFTDIGKFDRRIVFSHNDLKNVRYGAFLSQEGFEIEDIESYCDLFLNGHLHNGEKITDKIINLGNLTGQNFSEEATKYVHCAVMLDTETLELTYYENPFAFNFYHYYIDNINSFKQFLNNIKNNSVLTLKCREELHNEARALVENNPKISDKRFLIDISCSEKMDEEKVISELAQMDHVQTFTDYILNTLGSNDIVQTELMEISK